MPTDPATIACPTCAAPNPVGANFCSACGSGIAASADPSDVSNSGWDAAVSTAPATAGVTPDPAWVDDGSVRYCGFWRRWGAGILDQLIVTPTVALLAVGFVNVAGYSSYAGAWWDDFQYAQGGAYLTLAQENAMYATIAIVSLGWLVIYWLYSALQESSARQATLGQRALRVKVATTGMQRIGFGRATARVVVRLGVQVFIAFFDYAPVIFSRRKQAVHDMVVSTCVVRSPES